MISNTEPSSAPADEGLSLDGLSQAFAQMVGQGDDPYAPPTDAKIDPLVELDDAPIDASSPDSPVETNPRSILEAILFVGTADGRPIRSDEVAALMRGVRPAEIDDLVRELNARYDEAGSAFRIAANGAGYRLTLRTALYAVRDKFYGRVREAKLSPAAIEVLAVVAYHEPVTAEQVADLRGTPSGSILTQLVRRELLVLDRPTDRPKTPHYRTTRRFLQLFGITSLEDLPRSQELDA